MPKSINSLDRLHFYIGGRWVAPHGPQVRACLEAATGELLGHAAIGSHTDINLAVAAAREALDNGPWGASTRTDRASIMRRFAEQLRLRADFAARLVSRENGMPLGLSVAFNGTTPADLLDMYATLIDQTPLEELRPSAAGATIVRREPVGVVAAITPWNYPLALAMMKIAPALAAGCTIVLKPSPETALDSYLLGDAAHAAGLPDGVLNIVVTERDVASRLVIHPGVDKVAFTGSTVAGRQIASACGQLVRRVTLELGGKSAAIVLDDADLDILLAGLDTATLMNNGQTCTSQARILAPRSRYDEIVYAVRDYAARQVVGNPLDGAVTVGPMVSEQHQQRVLGHIQQGLDSGATLVTGGGKPQGIDRGWFVAPTVFADVDNASPLAREEIFGPVITVIPYDGDDEAVSLANDSDYGLGGSVWTADESRGIEIARRIRTGTIGVNYYILDTGAPFGGMKSSGIGRECGPEALHNYVEYKSMYVSQAAEARS